METAFISQNIDESRELLEELFQEVAAGEASKSGGTNLKVGAIALQQLRETKITFGNPHDNLIQLTEPLFREIGVELSQIHRQQMENRFDFYYMTLTVSMQPAPGAEFSKIECALDYSPKGKDEPIIQTIFPKSEWREMFKLGADINVGLNGNLDWVAGIDIPLEELSGNLKAKVVNNNDLKAFVAIPKYFFELGRADIAAMGEGNSECFWRIEHPELKKVQTSRFGVVFKVPKNTKTITLKGVVAVEPNFNWLTANLKYVFEALSQKLKDFLLLQDEKRTGKQRLPIGDHEKWTLTL